MSVISDLTKSIREEKEAARRYRERAKTADPRSRALWLHVAREEDVHAQEFTQRLKMVRLLRDMSLKSRK